MKKIVLVLTLIFAAGIIAASAQTSAKTEKQNTKTETVKSDDGAKAKGCCAYSTKSCKAGSMKCCMKGKAENSSAECASKHEAAANEDKENSHAENHK